MGLMLDMTARDLETRALLRDYIVIDEGKTPLKPKQLLTECNTAGPANSTAKGLSPNGRGRVKGSADKIDLRKLAHELEHQLERPR